MFFYEISVFKDIFLPLNNSLLENKIVARFYKKLFYKLIVRLLTVSGMCACRMPASGEVNTNCTFKLQKIEIMVFILNWSKSVIKSSTKKSTCLSCWLHSFTRLIFKRIRSIFCCPREQCFFISRDPEKTSKSSKCAPNNERRLIYSISL